MKLAYKGFNRTGVPVADTVEARDVADAKEILRRQGLFITSMNEVGVGEFASGGKREFASFLGHGKRLKQVAIFFRQMHVLIVTGTPLAESLAALERQSSDATWKRVLVDLREKVEQGVSLATSLHAHPKYFNAVSRGLITAGESGGSLAGMLERLSVLTRKQVHVRSSVIGAMVYPALLTCVAIGVLAILMLFVLPRFAALFGSLDTPLPPTTKFLMTLSDLTRSYWWAIPPVVISAAVGLWTFLKTPAGKRSRDGLFVFAPQFGPIVRSFETARIGRLMGILLQVKVPLLEALALTRDSTTNFYYSSLLADAVDAITSGNSLAGALDHPKLISPSVTEAIRSGEKSGQLGTLLATVADFLDEENDVTLRSLTSIIEPIILIVLGVLVGFIALSMFLPLFDLTAATGGA